MNRKSFLVTSVCVLCVLVAVMIVVGGCGTSTPQPTIVKCDPPRDTIIMVIQNAAVDYVRAHYPEQNLPVGDPWKVWMVSDNGHKYSHESWIVTWNREDSRWIVTNQVTGFRWEGDVYWSGGADYTLCRYTPEKIDRVEERSVTIPTPRITPLPTQPPKPDITPAPKPT